MRPQKVNPGRGSVEPVLALDALRAYPMPPADAPLIPALLDLLC